MEILSVNYCENQCGGSKEKALGASLDTIDSVINHSNGEAIGSHKLTCHKGELDTHESCPTVEWTGSLDGRFSTTANVQES